MYLIQPELTSAMWMKPSLFSYSSRVTKAPKFFTFATVQTTSSPSSGHSYACRGAWGAAADHRGAPPRHPPLARPEFGPRAVLHPLDLELDVLVAERTVTADTLGHLHGGATEHRYRGELLFEGSWVAVHLIESASAADENRSMAVPEHDDFCRSATSVRRLHRNKYILLN